MATYRLPPTTTAVGVHSLDQFVLAVPDLKPAQRFYASFGLDVREKDDRSLLHTFDHDHRWGSVVEGHAQALHHLSFGCYADDFARLKARVEAQRRGPARSAGRLREQRLLVSQPGRHPHRGEGRAEVVARPPRIPGRGTRARKAWPARRRAAGPGRCGRAGCRTSCASRPTSTARSNSTQKTLGLRLSDRSDFVAFMHGIHGSDHHLLAFAQSDAPGFHHCSWDVGSIDDIGLGAACMADKGFSKGWGLGRHVLGSNYFHYVQDPWGSFSEYSCDIDYIPKTQTWEAGYHKPEDSLSLWGPEPPDYFIQNAEAAN